MTQNYPPNPNQPYPPQQGYQPGPPPGYAPPQQPRYQQGPPQGYGQPGYGQAPGNYQPAQQNAPRVAPQGSPYPVLVSTMNDLPGYVAETVFGEARCGSTATRLLRR